MTILPRRRFLALGSAALALAASHPPRARAAQGYEDMRRHPTPPLRLPDLEGRPVDLDHYRGRAVMVNFWADWCPPCLVEIPSLNRAWITMRSAGVELLTVHVGGTAQSVTHFVQDRGLKFPVLLDADAKAFKQWPTQGLPTTFIITPNGKLALAAAGAREWDPQEMMAPILALLKTQT